MNAWRRAAALPLPRPPAFSYLASEINVTLSWGTSTLTSPSLLYATDKTTFRFSAVQTILLRIYSLTYPFKDECFIFWFTSLAVRTRSNFSLLYYLYYYLFFFFFPLFIQHSIQDSEKQIFHKKLDSK